MVKRKNNLLILVIFGIFLVTTIGATIQTLPPVKQNNCVNLTQIYGNSTFQNITVVNLPNRGDFITINQEMNNSHPGYFSYEFCNTSTLGEYIVNGIGDVDGELQTWNYNFFVTSTGQRYETFQGLMIIGQIGLMALFLIIGFSFNKEKWKLKTSFFTIALLMGVIVLNSIRIIAAESSELNTMGNVGLYLGIVMVLVMILYLFINYTIEIFTKIKSKKEMRWSPPRVNA